MKPAPGMINQGKRNWEMRIIYYVCMSPYIKLLQQINKIMFYKAFYWRGILFGIIFTTYTSFSVFFMLDIYFVFKSYTCVYCNSLPD